VPEAHCRSQSCRGGSSHGEAGAESWGRSNIADWAGAERRQRLYQVRWPTPDAVARKAKLHSKEKGAHPWALLCSAAEGHLVKPVTGKRATGLPCLHPTTILQDCSACSPLYMGKQARVSYASTQAHLLPLPLINTLTTLSTGSRDKGHLGGRLPLLVMCVRAHASHASMCTVSPCCTYAINMQAGSDCVHECKAVCCWCYESNRDSGSSRAATARVCCSQSWWQQDAWEGHADRPFALKPGSACIGGWAYIKKWIRQTRLQSKEPGCATKAACCAVLCCVCVCVCVHAHTKHAHHSTNVQRMQSCVLDSTHQEAMRDGLAVTDCTVLQLVGGPLQNDVWRAGGHEHMGLQGHRQKMRVLQCGVGSPPRMLSRSCERTSGKQGVLRRHARFPSRGEVVKDGHEVHRG